jgi:hypothetical protein
MKKIILSLSILFSVASFCQDSTIATFSIKHRLVQLFIPFVKHNEDTAYVNLYNRWMKKFPDPKNLPAATVQISVDTIAVTVIADIYDLASSFPQGASAVLADLQSDVATIRAQNSYLFRLLKAVDDKYAAIVPSGRSRGKKVETASNQ